MLPVSVVKIHHEGGGKPNDVPKNGYSIWIGPSGAQLVRPPNEDWSTLNLNHVVMGVCFSGQRQDGVLDPQGKPYPAYDVTDKELADLEHAIINARKRGWIIPHPVVSPHDNLSGSATACPGSRVYARWKDIEHVCTSLVPAPIPTPPPKESDMIALPQKGSPQGRIPTARVALNGVLLENGGRITGDKPSGDNRFWQPDQLPPGATIIGIAKIEGARQIVALYDYHQGDTGTYIGVLP